MTKKSPFPTDYTGVDLYFDDEWNNITPDADQVGFNVEHSSEKVSTMDFRLTNSDGKYSPRNPTSPLYGKVGKNVPVRSWVELGAPWLELPGGRATTPDVAALDIVGDIDIRWFGYRDNWDTAADLISKWLTTGNQRSWLVRAEGATSLENAITFFWTTDGSGSTVNTANSTIGIPAYAGKIALRVTLDVNNGAGGHTVNFSYSDSLSGTWWPLGEPVIGSGTTSIFNSSAALTVGKEPTSVAGSPSQRVYGWEVRNPDAAMPGLVVVSSRTTSALTIGATSFIDDQGRTWTITNGSITNRHILGVCEGAEWPVTWNRKGAPSVMTNVGAAGVRRRLGQGEEALRSVFYRTISATPDGMIGYWPMEDGSDATAFGPAVGSKPAAMGSEVNPASYANFRGSDPLPTLGGSRIRAEVDSAPDTGDIQVRWVQWTPNEALPTSTVVLCRVEFTGGTVGHVDVEMRDSDSAIGVFGYDHDGTQMSGSTFFTFTSIKGTSQRLSLELEQDGADLDFRFVKLAPGDTSASSGSGTFTFPHDIGRVRQIILNPNYRDLPNMAVGHLTVENVITSIFDVSSQPLVGFDGEQASARLGRLAVENKAVVYVRGRSRGTTQMGSQRSATLLNLLAESAEADAGIIHDASDGIAIRYRSLSSMYRQPPLVIPYTDNKVIPFEPVDDDALTRNRVTVSRPNGTAFTAEATEGPLSILPPPNGVGVYDESVTRNLFNDTLTERTAWWRLHIGTWDEERYPNLGVDLANPAFLNDPNMLRDLLSLTIGDHVVISDPPSWRPPEDVDVIITGIRYEVTPLHLRILWTCVPGRPYNVAMWNAGDRYSGQGTVTSGSLTTTATSIALTCPSGTSWTHTDGNYDILIDGERMTVTNVVGNTMTVARSVNGVVKTHTAGAVVELAQPAFYAR